MSETKPLPCPFCGHVGLDFAEGSTFRWVLASCAACGATCGETRIQTCGDGTPQEWCAAARANSIAAWNRRTPTEPPKEHNMTPAEHAKAIENAAMAYASISSEYARRGLVTPDQCWKSLKAAIIAGVGAAPPKDSAEFALAALVAAGHVSQSKVDYARALMPPPESKAEQHDSDCAKHNAPAYPPGPCDCSLSKAAPEGWQLVPVAPTHAMLAAAAITRAEYSAMLAAAPKP